MRNPNKMSRIILTYLALMTMQSLMGKDVTFNLEEETGENYHVGMLSADRANVDFLKIDSPLDGSIFFDVDKTSGEVKVSRRLDREKICPTSVNPYQMNYNVKITDDGQCIIKFEVNEIERDTGNLHDAINVHVNIIDINDNACYFDPNPQVVEIDENEKPGEFKMAIHMPRDPDSERLGYAVDKNNIRLVNNDYFILDPIASDDKRLYLRLTKALDYESIQRIPLKIENNNYNDKGCNLNLTVVIRDVNDNHPKFLQHRYFLDLTEDAPVNSVLLTLEASDLDADENGRIIFEIDNLSSNPEFKKYLKIDRDNGSLLLQKKFNYKDVKELKLFVNAKNPKEPKVTAEDPSLSIAEVVIRISDINDHSPKIRVLSILNNNQNLTVEEELEAGQKKDIARVSVSDEDSGINAEINCHLVDLSSSGDYLSLAEINKMTYKVVMEKSVDREVTPMIPFEIICRDNGKPPLSTSYKGQINVLDVNDNAPVFVRSDYLIEVVEDTSEERKKGDYEISQFLAIDKDIGNNGHVEYSFLDHEIDVLSFFKIDPSTGKLSSRGNLDRESFETFNFKVVARDDGITRLSSTTDVTIRILDYNDNQPKFERDVYVFDVVEHSPDMTFVGSIYVEDRDLDVSSKINVNFMGTTMMSKIISDSYTNEFLYSTEIKENPSQWFKLKTIQVTNYSQRIDIHLIRDVDREKFYTDLRSNQDNKVPVDPITTRPVIEFQLDARDAGSPQLNSMTLIKVVILDLNDNPPMWKYTGQTGKDMTQMKFAQFNVSIDEAPGFPFAVIETEDLDAGENGTVKYQITDGNSQGLFEINEMTGQISLAQHSGYASLAKILYPLKIRASDSSHVNPHTRDIRIGIRVDDSEPRSPYSSAGDIFKSTNSNRRVNFLIIIAIVTASFIVSTVLLTSICIVLKKAKNDGNLNQRHHPGYKTNGFYDIQKNIVPSVASNQQRNDESSLLYYSGTGKIFPQDTSDYGNSESNYCQQGSIIGYPCNGTLTMKEDVCFPYPSSQCLKTELYGSYPTGTANLSSPCNSISWTKAAKFNHQMNSDKLYEDQDSGNGDSLETTATPKPSSLILHQQQYLHGKPNEDFYYPLQQHHGLSQSILELNAEPVLRYTQATTSGDINDATNKGATLTSSFV